MGVRLHPGPGRCRKAACRERRLVAATVSSMPSPTADLRNDCRVGQRQLSASFANGSSRPSAGVSARRFPWPSARIRSGCNRPRRCAGIQVHRVERTRGTDEQPVQLRPTEAHVGHSLRHTDLAEELAFGGIAMHAVARARPQMPLSIDAKPVEEARGAIGEDLAVEDGCSRRRRPGSGECGHSGCPTRAGNGRPRTMPVPRPIGSPCAASRCARWGRPIAGSADR